MSSPPPRRASSREPPIGRDSSAAGSRLASRLSMTGLRSEHIDGPMREGVRSRVPVRGDLRDPTTRSTPRLRSRDDATTSLGGLFESSRLASLPASPEVSCPGRGSTPHSRNGGGRHRRTAEVMHRFRVEIVVDHAPRNLDSLADRHPGVGDLGLSAPDVVLGPRRRRLRRSGVGTDPSAHSTAGVGDELAGTRGVLGDQMGKRLRPGKLRSAPRLAAPLPARRRAVLDSDHDGSGGRPARRGRDVRARRTSRRGPLPPCRPTCDTVAARSRAVRSPSHREHPPADLGHTRLSGRRLERGIPLVADEPGGPGGSSCDAGALLPAPERFSTERLRRRARHEDPPTRREGDGVRGGAVPRRRGGPLPDGGSLCPRDRSRRRHDERVE